MKRTLEEHADRFSEKADEYDESQQSDEYLACANLVVERAAPGPEDVVLDLGTGTGAIALALAADAARVVGRDISEGMLEQARQKAEDRGTENVEFGEGRFREPNYDGPVDIVTTNFAMHHLSDEQKREAIEVVGDLGPRRFVIGDVMLFGEADPSEPYYDPAVDDPATVGVLADALTDAGFALTAVERVHDQVGVLVAERAVGAVQAGSEAGSDAETGSDAGADANAQTGDEDEIEAEVHSDAPGAPDLDEATDAGDSTDAGDADG